MRRLLLAVGMLLGLGGCPGTPAPADSGPADAPIDRVVPDANIVDAPTDIPVATDATDAAPRDDGPADVATDGGGLDAPVDSPTDAPRDVPSDAPGDVATDAPTDSPMDVTADAAPDAAGTSCGPGRTCAPFICTCGRCDPAQIQCVSDGRVCPLACPLACPELATVTCGCVGGSCARTDLPTDAGADADAGGLPEGTVCGATDTCATGLLCCYPCGIPGCTNRCSRPDSRTGRCPLLP